jgi:Na+/proline symporter
MTPLAALSFFFVFGMGSLGQPQGVHKYYMLRDPMQLKWYPLLKTLGLILVLLLYFGVGVGVKAFVTNGTMAPLTAPDQATPSLLLSVTPLVLAALVFSGVAAATMSAANSFINIGAAIVMHDLPIAFGKRLTNELRWGRAMTLLIAVAAAIIAQNSGTMVAFLGIFGWGLFASTLVPALAVGLNWEGATREGAIASIATGLVVTIALEVASYAKVFTFPSGVTASAVALVMSFLMFFFVSWLTRRSAPEQIDPDVKLIMDL